jgi:hypothetical protein
MTTAITAHPEIREAISKLCERFPGEYWRELDRKREYPTEFVRTLTESGPNQAFSRP